MMLNEQFISDMFHNQVSQQQLSIPQEVSLNFTVTSRSTKHHQKQSTHSPNDHHKYLPEQTIDIANHEIANSNQQLVDIQYKFQTCHSIIEALMLELSASNGMQTVFEQDLLIIKRQVLKRESQIHRQCFDCQHYKQQLEELQRTIKKQGKYIDENEASKRKLEGQLNRLCIEAVKEGLVRDVQLTLLSSEIKDLNTQISTLKNQKCMLERTFLFNKTRNSQLNMLQKSKSLSAAKNSTNSSQLNMIRNHENIIFIDPIDPIESDVDEWIRFFQEQKSRYLSLLKKQQVERNRDLARCMGRQQNRSMCREERFEESNENKLNTLHTCLKEIHINLLRIRQNTSSFQMIESNKYGLRQKITNNNEADWPSKKQQIQNLGHTISDLKLKLQRSTRINASLLQEKQNIEEISRDLKQQRMRQKVQRHSIYEELLRKTQQHRHFQQKYLQFKQKLTEMAASLKSTEDLIKDITSELKCKEEQICKYKQQQKYYTQLSNTENELAQHNKGYQLQINSLLLKLKKDCFQRRKIYGQLEELKGNVRLYCRIIDQKALNQQMYPLQDLVTQVQNQKVFNRLFYGHNNSQQKVYEDIQKLVNGAFDGYHLTLLSYSHAAASKSHTMHGTNENPGIIPRVFKEIFKCIEAQKQFMEVEVSLSVLQCHNDKFTGLLANQKMLSYQIKQNQEGNVYLANYPQFTVQTHLQLSELYQDCLSSKKSRQKYKPNNRAHFIITISLQIFNKKTQETYKSKIHLIQLAQMQRNMPGELPMMMKEHSSVNRSISSLLTTLRGLHLKQKVNLRQSKLTHYLKDSLSPQNKTILLFTFSSAELLKQETTNFISFASRFRSANRQFIQQDREQHSRQRTPISMQNNRQSSQHDREQHSRPRTPISMQNYREQHSWQRTPVSRKNI